MVYRFFFSTRTYDLANCLTSSCRLYCQQFRDVIFNELGAEGRLRQRIEEIRVSSCVSELWNIYFTFFKTFAEI